MILTRTAAPAPFIGLPDFKLHLNMEAAFVDHDAQLVRMLTAATARFDGVDGVLGGALGRQEWLAAWPAAPSARVLRLPLPPLISVDAITYDDADGIEQTIAPGDYRAIPGDDAILELTAGAAWPSTGESLQAFRVAFTCGYTTVPPELVQAILMLAASWYDHREAVLPGLSVAEIPLGVRDLAAPFRRLDHMLGSQG